jgi:hypothetical protein
MISGGMLVSVVVDTEFIEVEFLVGFFEGSAKFRLDMIGVELVIGKGSNVSAHVGGFAKSASGKSKIC